MKKIILIFVVIMLFSCENEQDFIIKNDNLKVIDNRTMIYNCSNDSLIENINSIK